MLSEINLMNFTNKKIISAYKLVENFLYPLREKKKKKTRTYLPTVDDND